MSAPRIILANCANPCDHPIHVSRPGRSMYQCVDGYEIRLCPGGRMGDKRVREYAGRLDELAEIVRIENVSAELAELLGETETVDWSKHSATKSFDARSLEDDDREPPEPDFDEEYEADRAAERYANSLDI